jgi:hypothetical protein
MRIILLDQQRKIFALLDDKGVTIGTGSREVCEVLLCIVIKPITPPDSERAGILRPANPNVRSAITI